MGNATDEKLVLKIKDGDLTAFEILVKRYQKRLFYFVYRLTRDFSVSEEIVQDAFLNLYKTIDRVDTRKKFPPYIFQIAKNIAFSYLRKHKKEISLNEEVAGTSESVYEKLIRSDVVNLVRAKLNELSLRDRQIIMLYYFEDLSYNQMQKKLKLPLNTVRTRLRRAKIELLKLFNTSIDYGNA
jgi:RNA polymerase sigma-70 factor (ECF subfamily)